MGDNSNEEATTPADERQRIYKRTLIVVVCSQILAGMGIAAGVTVGALLAEDMLDSTSASGLPSGLFTLGSAGAAYIVGRVSQARGRRVGLSVGYLGGAVGGAGVVLAALLDSPALLFLAFFIYGSGISTNLQARYAGTDLAPARRRGQAISTVMVATTIGAVAGPNLVDPLRRLAGSIAVPELAGPFLLSIAAYGLAAIVLTLFLRPDPLLFARDAARAARPAATHPTTGRPARAIRRALGLGAATMIISQMVMVAIMSMTPIHMRDHGHGLSATGLVIAIHVAGMYLPSPLTGWLLDTVGRIPLMMAAAVTLPASGIIAAIAPPDSVAIIALALGLLGVGWNLGLVSGTAMVTDATQLENRAATQGSIDVLVALSSAGGGVMSGVILAATSYTTLALLGGAIALALTPIVVMTRTASAGRTTTA